MAEKGDSDGALAYHAQALAIARESGDRASIGHWLGNIASGLLEHGDHSTATAHLEEALAIAREIGDRLLEGVWLGMLGRVRLSRGDYDEVQAVLTEALAIAREIGDRTREHWWLTDVGDVARVYGDYDTALELYDQALDICRDVGERASEPGLLARLGHIAVVRGDEGAVGRYQAAHDAALRLGRAAAAEFAVLLGELTIDHGEVASARKWADEARAIPSKFSGRAEALDSADSGASWRSSVRLTPRGLSARNRRSHTWTASPRSSPRRRLSRGKPGFGSLLPSAPRSSGRAWCSLIRMRHG